MNRFLLPSNYDTILFPAFQKMKANGFVYTVRLRKDRALGDSSVGEYMHRKSAEQRIAMERQLVIIF